MRKAVRRTQLYGHRWVLPVGFNIQCVGHANPLPFKRGVSYGVRSMLMPGTDESRLTLTELRIN